MALTNELDPRINEYELSVVFDTSDDGETNFSSLGATHNIAEFKGVNSSYNLDIRKKTFQYADKDTFNGTIYHKQGTPTEKTKAIPAPELNDHFGHGDYLGSEGMI